MCIAVHGEAVERGRHERDGPFVCPGCGGLWIVATSRDIDVEDAPA